MGLPGRNPNTTQTASDPQHVACMRKGLCAASSHNHRMRTQTRQLVDPLDGVFGCEVDEFLCANAVHELALARASVYSDN